MSFASTSQRPLIVPAFREAARAFVLNAFRKLALWQQLMQTRHVLASLDDRLLKDIGLSRAQAWHESAKPFWRE